METGSWGREDLQQGGAGGPSEVADCGMGQARLQLADPMAPHSHVDKPRGTVGERNRLHNPGLPALENKASNL